MGRKKNATSEMNVAEKQSTSLATRLTELITDGEALKKHLDVSSQAINQYKLGISRPSLDNLCKIADYYKVSVDYLLGRTNTQTVEEDIQIARETTGLSEESVKALRSLNEWGFTEEARVIDFLLFDDARRYPGHNFRGILDLLHFFLEYDDEQAIKKQVSINGAFRDIPSGSIGVSIDSIQIDQRIIENAVLNEIQQALISVKRKLLEDRKAAEASNGKQ